MVFARTDTSVLGHWVRTVDKTLLFSVLVLAGLGIALVFAGSPSVAQIKGFGRFYFVERHLVFLPVALAVMFAVSMCQPVAIRRLGLIVFAGAFVLLALVPLIGVENNGARRWISLGVASLQPSEFVKPGLAILTAWLLAEQSRDPRFPGGRLAIGVVAMVVALLVIQPDIGQAAVVIAVWLTQLFLAGLSLWILGACALAGAAGLATAYVTLPHVAARIDRFIDPAAGDSYQITRSLSAFKSGGLFGRGAGEGIVKTRLPDAHSDFVFAVAGEELGIIAAFAIVALFAFIVVRGFARARRYQSLFGILAVAGLLTEFGLQALINTGSTLDLIPTKGMTLPFISYGGSSLVAMGFTMGAALALTRRRPLAGGDP